MKTKEELNALKEEVENVRKKLAELTEDELAQVTGGLDFPSGGDGSHVYYGSHDELPGDAAGQTGKFGTGFIGTHLLSD